MAFLFSVTVLYSLSTTSLLAFNSSAVGLRFINWASKTSNSCFLTPNVCSRSAISLYSIFVVVGAVNEEPKAEIVGNPPKSAKGLNFFSKVGAFNPSLGDEVVKLFDVIERCVAPVKLDEVIEGVIAAGKLPVGNAGEVI